MRGNSLLQARPSISTLLKRAEEVPQLVDGRFSSSGVQRGAKDGFGGDRILGYPRIGRSSSGGTMADQKLDRRSQIEFWAVQGVMFGMSITAIETTHNCLQAGSCTAIPDALQSRGAQYMLGIPMVVGVAILSYELKKHNKGWWFVPPAAVIAGAGVLTYHSIRASH